MALLLSTSKNTVDCDVFLINDLFHLMHLLAPSDVFKVLETFLSFIKQKIFSYVIFHDLISKNPRVDSKHWVEKWLFSQRTFSCLPVTVCWCVTWAQQPCYQQNVASFKTLQHNLWRDKLATYNCITRSIKSLGQKFLRKQVNYMGP